LRCRCTQRHVDAVTPRAAATPPPVRAFLFSAAEFGYHVTRCADTARRYAFSSAAMSSPSRRVSLFPVAARYAATAAECCCRYADMRRAAAIFAVSAR